MLTLFLRSRDLQAVPFVGVTNSNKLTNSALFDGKREKQAQAVELPSSMQTNDTLPKNCMSRDFP